jgi:hypothetical protein
MVGQTEHIIFNRNTTPTIQINISLSIQLKLILRHIILVLHMHAPNEIISIT